MSISEIEAAIAQLPPDQVSALMSWLEEYHAKVWDKLIENDLESGRLDGVLAEVEKELMSAECGSRSAE